MTSNGAREKVSLSDVKPASRADTLYQTLIPNLVVRGISQDITFTDTSGKARSIELPRTGLWCITTVFKHWQFDSRRFREGSIRVRLGGPLHVEMGDKPECKFDVPLVAALGFVEGIYEVQVRVYAGKGPPESPDMAIRLIPASSLMPPVRAADK